MNGHILYSLHGPPLPGMHNTSVSQSVESTMRNCTPAQQRANGISGYFEFGDGEC